MAESTGSIFVKPHIQPNIMADILHSIMAHNLHGREDGYGRVIISCPSSQLAGLDSTLALCQKQGIREVRLILYMPKQSALIHKAIQKKFEFVTADSTKVELRISLPDDMQSTNLDDNPHHIGVGAFVLNYDGEVLAVQEKSGVFGGGNIWKLPTGSLYQGEDISARVVRVVKELTGIDTKFEQVVAFRRSNEVPYYQTNTFYMCTLGPLSTITVQDTDSMAVKWMPLGEFESQEYLKEKEMLRRMLDGCIKSTKEAQYTGYRMEDIHAGTGQEPAIFYHNGF